MAGPATTAAASAEGGRSLHTAAGKEGSRGRKAAEAPAGDHGKGWAAFLGAGKQAAAAEGSSHHGPRRTPEELHWLGSEDQASQSCPGLAGRLLAGLDGGTKWDQLAGRQSTYSAAPYHSAGLPSREPSTPEQLEQAEQWSRDITHPESGGKPHLAEEGGEIPEPDHEDGEPPQAGVPSNTEDDFDDHQ